MSNPIILSDDDTSPLPSLSKKSRFGPGPMPESTPTVLIIDDDPTPQKPGPTSTPSIVPETPMFHFSAKSRTSAPMCRQTFTAGSRMNEGKENVAVVVDDDDDVVELVEGCGFVDFTRYAGDSSSTRVFGDSISQQTSSQDDKNDGAKKTRGRKKMTVEERERLKEEKKLMKEQAKLEKAAQKAQAAEMKKMEKEKQKWEKGKFALQSIVAEIDTKIVEQGSIGGHLLTSFANKGLAYRIKSNPIEWSIVWTMIVPEHVEQLASGGTEIQYVLLVYEAEEFCNLVISDNLGSHVSRVQSSYPSHTICYVTNKLMSYIHKRERQQFKNPESDKGWRRPPVEEVLAQLSTHFFRVHHRECVDEAELAEHVVGLTCSLASCQFRKKLTRLSISANGSLIPKDFIDKDLIKKSTWLKALVAIPKLQPRFAIAIWKKYPTMKSLLNVYMDPNKSVHEKEFLLEVLKVEGLTGGERRVGQICSKRVYRVLMAQSGSIKTDDVEDGADFFQDN